MSGYFDALAPAYDADFTATPLARALRGRVWARLDQLFPAPPTCSNWPAAPAKMPATWRSAA